MDDYCRMLVEYVAIIAAPLLETPLGILTLVVVAVGLAVAVAAIVALVASWPSASSAVSASASVITRFESSGSRLPRGRARARAPSVGVVHRA